MTQEKLECSWRDLKHSTCSLQMYGAGTICLSPDLILPRYLGADSMCTVTLKNHNVLRFLICELSCPVDVKFPEAVIRFKHQRQVSSFKFHSDMLKSEVKGAL